MINEPIRIINVTPHDVNIQREDGVIITVPPSEIPARAERTQQITGSLFGVPVKKTTYSDVTGLPEPEEGTIYIVSSIILEVCSDRKDIIAPNTDGTAIRDETGRVRAVTSFQSN